MVRCQLAQSRLTARLSVRWLQPAQKLAFHSQ